ncbi:MAG: STAS domain-containing protein, partial [bacterium]|nr:STAS domain-containing protein [bacterium]
MNTLIEITIHHDRGIPCAQLCGRMDSMTSNEVQKSFNDLILQGVRKFLVDLEQVAYLSSAGLRVFMSAQKQLKKVDGELIFFKPSAQVMEVFQLSGFGSFFQILQTEEECAALVQDSPAFTEIETQTIDGVVFQFMRGSQATGQWSEIGSQHKLAESGFGEEDVVSVKASEIAFGTGLATLGDSFDEYKNYFGEAVVLNHNFFFYPAVKHPAVDFMLCQEESAALEYKFLHGFQFNGAFSTLVAFEAPEPFITLADLTKKILTLTQANQVGMVL